MDFGLKTNIKATDKAKDLDLLATLRDQMGPLSAGDFVRVRNFLMVNVCMQNANCGGVLRTLTHGNLQRVTEAYNGHFILSVSIIMFSVLSTHNIYTTQKTDNNRYMQQIPTELFIVCECLYTVRRP